MTSSINTSVQPKIPYTEPPLLVDTVAMNSASKVFAMKNSSESTPLVLECGRSKNRLFAHTRACAYGSSCTLAIILLFAVVFGLSKWRLDMVRESSSNN